MSRLLHTDSVRLTVILFLVQGLASVARGAAVRQARAADDGDSATGSATPGQKYDEEKLKIWRKSVEDVIEHKLSGMCRTMILAVKGADQTPDSACAQLTNNKFIMRISCTGEDVKNMEEVVCGYGSIVLPTNPSDVAPTTPSQENKTSTSTTSSTSSVSSSSPLSSAATMPSSSSSSSFSSSSQLLSSTKAKQAPPSDMSPSPQEVAILPIPDSSNLENQQKDFPTKDSRISDKCNQVVPHLVQVFADTKDRTRSGCTHLHRIAIVSATEAEQNDLIASFPEAKALLSSCSQNDLHLLHGMLCAHNGGAEPEHALQGRQQERVNYVIKTELTASCRNALSPLGENQMEEDVEDSCLTLSGAHGNELVSNDLCTPNDLDNLLKVVCDSAPTLGTLQSQALALTAAFISYYLVVDQLKL